MGIDQTSRLRLNDNKLYYLLLIFCFYLVKFTKFLNFNNQSSKNTQSDLIFVSIIENLSYLQTYSVHFPNAIIPFNSKIKSNKQFVDIRVEISEIISKLIGVITSKGNTERLLGIYLRIVDVSIIFFI